MLAACIVCSSRFLDTAQATPRAITSSAPRRMVYSPPRRAVQDVFICFACDESEGAFAKENHRAEHNLVRCMEKEVVAVKTSADDRLIALELQMGRMEKLLQLLVDGAHARFSSGEDPETEG